MGTREVRKAIPRSRPDRVYQKTGHRCWYCGGVLRIGENASVDHIVPLSRGGTNDVSNLLPSCKPCNNKKGDRTLEEYRSARGGVTFWGETQGRRMARLSRSADTRATARTRRRMETC